MRLVFGNISLFHGLAVIMLAPEVFEPLRQVGAQFHASANGVTASKAAFDIIEEAEAVASPGTDECPDMARTDIVLDGLGVRARGAWAPAPTSGVITPGIVTALCGPSGAGKSTIVACLLADMTPDAGRILLRPSPRPPKAASPSCRISIPPRGAATSRGCLNPRRWYPVRSWTTWAICLWTTSAMRQRQPASMRSWPAPPTGGIPSSAPAASACPSVSANASPSREPSPHTPRSLSSTSPQRTSMPSAKRPSCGPLTRCGTRDAPSSSSRTAQP